MINADLRRVAHSACDIAIPKFHRAGLVRNFRESELLEFSEPSVDSFDFRFLRRPPGSRHQVLAFLVAVQFRGI